MELRSVCVKQKLTLSCGCIYLEGDPPILEGPYELRRAARQLPVNYSRYVATSE